MVGYDTREYYGHYYIVKKGEKFGLLTDKYQLLSEPILDDVILYNPQNHILKGCLRIEDRYIEGSTQGVTFVIARLGKKYKLFNSRNCHIILDDCDLIKYTSFRKWDDSEPKDYIEFHKENIYGCVLWNEKIISNQEYDEIRTDQFYIYVKKNAKQGVFLSSGKQLFPCIYDKICYNGPKDFTLIKDGIEKKVHVRFGWQSSHNLSRERPTYERYAGTYAQDVMGYSDDDIDIIFDGDPSAYWNID